MLPKREQTDFQEPRKTARTQVCFNVPAMSQQLAVVIVSAVLGAGIF